MGPVATGGPPHTRASSINGGPVRMANSTKSNGADGLKGASRVFPHLDDLVAVEPDVDMYHWPMRRLLQEGELLAKQADTHLDFRRPDMALQEYIKATIIAVEYVPRHKDYPSLQADRGELHRLYTGLNKRINVQHGKFAEVKDIIKENNARSGVTSTRSTSRFRPENAAPVGNGHVRTQSVYNGPSNGTSTNGINSRKKPPPPVQPKPDALHGKVIQPAETASSTVQTDLAARFARLRSPERINSGQDPRIRTQPIVVPANIPPLVPQSKNTTMSRPIGPRELPSVPQNIPRHMKIPLDVAIPAMPRAPDAIYSPASGVESSATVNLPSSIVRTSSYLANGRKNSAPPVSTVGPTPDLNESRKDYFSPAHTINDDDYEQMSQKRQAPQLPDATTVTAEELMKYLSQSISVLIVDVRSRAEFESGHIMSQSVICVEPITLRTGISGEQLGDSLIIAPDSEQALYERRTDFDLVVFYDQSSRSIDQSPSFARDSNSLLRDFSAAVYDYGYEKRVKRRPMLLVGGLDAWVDLLGPNSLRASQGNKLSASKTQSSSTRSLGRFSMADSQRRPMARINTRTSRLLSKDEETQWNLTLKNEPAPKSPDSNEPDDHDEFVYARTIEGFLNKYPEMPVIQESMMTQKSTVRPVQGATDEFVSNIPQLPTRPAPALPRQRSNGLHDRGAVTSYAASAGTISSLKVSPGLTGLDNPGYLCYFNASLQALSATPFLRNLIRNFRYGQTVRIPKRPEEASEHPQLLVRFLSNLLNYMWGGQYDYLEPTTLARYINNLHFKSGETSASNIRSFCYGGKDRQQDAQEFFSWLIDLLDDEINPGRDRRSNNGQPILPKDIVRRLNSLPLTQAAQESWRHLMGAQQSQITQRMTIQECRTSVCRTCGTASRIWSPYVLLNVSLGSAPSVTLHDRINVLFGPGSAEDRPEIECDSEACSPQLFRPITNPPPDRPVKPTKRIKTFAAYLSRLPDYLCLFLGRFEGGAGDRTNRNNALVTFPEKGIDLTRFFCPPDAFPDREKDHEHRGPFLYDVYAVVQHIGNLNSGHYFAIAKSPDLPNNPNGAGSWHKYNDRKVEPSSFQATQSERTYLVFLKRQGTPN